MNEDVLAIWTVYERPTDYPDKFVARRFEIDGDGYRPTSSIVVARNLKALRAVLAVDLHLTCLARNPSDEPHIVETWL